MKRHLDQTCDGESPPRLSIEESLREGLTSLSLADHLRLSCDLSPEAYYSSDSQRALTPTRSSRSESTSNTSVDEISILLGAKLEYMRPSIGSNTFLSSPQDEYLELIHPSPTFPPEYRDLPPGGCPKFPILDELCGREQLPAYSPAVYKLAICQRKQEWLSPYELSPTRGWRSVVAELNSTQLNFYSVSEKVESALIALQGKSSNCHQGMPEIHDRNFFSILTTNVDMTAHKICHEAGIVAWPTEPEVRLDLNSNSSKTRNSLKSAGRRSLLLRSYSLQHSKLGLASDYTKRPNVLRLRLENEQFLLHFGSTQDLVDWNLALSIGKDVSLDLKERDSPKYRTVPRRRRNTVPRVTPFFNDVVTRRLRANSEPNQSSSLRLPDKLSKIRHRLGAGRGAPLALMPRSRTFADNNAVQISDPSSRRGLEHPIAEIPAHSTELLNSSTTSNNDFDISSDSMDDASFSNRTSLDGSAIYHHARETGDDTDDDAVNLTDIPNSDEECESDFNEEVEPSLQQISVEALLTPASEISMKWNPSQRRETKRRHLRNCVKCIRSLTFDESWINKVVVKPTPSTSIDSMYKQKYLPDSCSLDSSRSSLQSSHTTCEGFHGSNSNSKLKTSMKSRAKPTSVALERVTHHHLKEYIVGSHSLIPKIV